MSARLSAAPAAGVLLLAAGCACVSVVKVDPGDGVPGIRYSLPQPFVVVTPQADGTLDVRVEMLPDPASTYAVESASFLAAHEASLQLTASGLLAEADLTEDASAVAAEAARAAGQAGRAYRAARMAEESADRERRRDEEAKRRSAAADLGRKAAEAEADLAAARAERDALLERRKSVPIDEDDLTAAETRLRAAEARLAALRAQLDRLLSTGLLLAASRRAGSTGTEEAFGPLFFRVVEDPSTGGVRLEAAEDQGRYRTYRASGRRAGE